MSSLAKAILIVTPFKLSAIGGVTTAVKMLEQEFSAQGCKVHILVAGDNKFLKHQLVEGRSVYTLYLRWPQHDGPRVLEFLKFLLLAPVTLWQLNRLCRQQQIAVVYVQYPLPQFVYLGLLRRVSRWKLVLTFQGSDAHRISSWRGLNYACLQYLLNSSDHISAVAQSLLQKMSVVFPSIAVSQSVIPNGSTAPNNNELCVGEKFAESETFIFSAGHLIHRKGFDILIRGFSKSHKLLPGLHLIIAGEGAEHDSLRKLVKECNVEGLVHLVGWCDHKQTLDLMSRCLFFALTSRAEGLPLVIAEAMMKGKTVLATAVDGVPDIVKDRITGILVEPEDYDAVAAGIYELTTDVGLRILMGRTAQVEAIHEFNWESIAERYLRIGGLTGSS